MSDRQRREFHAALLDADAFDVPGKWRDGGALDRSFVKGRVGSDAQSIEQVPARNAGGYRAATARVGRSNSGAR